MAYLVNGLNMRVVALDASVPIQVESLDSDFPSGRYEFLCTKAENWAESGSRVANLGLILGLITR